MIINTQLTEMSDKLEISKHAIQRFKDRVTVLPDSEIKHLISSMMEKRGVEVFLKEKWQLKELLNHHFTKAKYFKGRIHKKTVIIVIVESTVVTLHLDDYHKYSTKHSVD